MGSDGGPGRLQWSVIGHLQTNKAKLVARFASEFQALDSLRVAEALERRLQAEGRGLDVFVQVNTSGEASKYGLPPDEVAAFLRQLSAFPALRVRGLMTWRCCRRKRCACAAASCCCANCATGCARTSPLASASTSCRWACPAIMNRH